MAKAKASKKLSEEYQIPKQFRNNFPETIRLKIQPFKKNGLFPLFPFGTDFTEEEQVLGKALKSIKNKTRSSLKKLMMVTKAMATFNTPSKTRLYLKRMQLEHPKTLKEKLYKRILINELNEILF